MELKSEVLSRLWPQVACGITRTATESESEAAQRSCALGQHFPFEVTHINPLARGLDGTKNLSCMTGRNEIGMTQEILIKSQRDLCLREARALAENPNATKADLKLARREKFAQATGEDHV